MDWKNKYLKIAILLIIFMVIATNFLIITVGMESCKEDMNNGSRSSRALGFTEISSGLPAAGDYNYIAAGDFNTDGFIDIAFGGEDYSAMNTIGLYAYTSDGGSSWTEASSGLPSENSWGGLQLVDADGDGYMELYATDEPWGTANNQGLKVFEYRSGSWTDSASHVSTPFTDGTADNVIIKDITGDDKLDMVLCKKVGLEYYENGGGNPVSWTEKSDGLPNNPEFTAAAVDDMNKDGLQDIVVADYSGNEYMFVQQSSGTLWAEYSDGLTGGGNTLGATVGDVNGDSHMDVIFGGSNDGLKCWLGNSGGSSGTDFTWTDGSSNLPTSGRYCQIQLVDIDADGDLDLIAPATSSGKGMQIYIGTGSTGPVSTMSWDLASDTGLASTGNYCGANYYDINNDGNLDLIGASWSDKGVKAWLSSGGTVPPDESAPSQITDLAVSDLTEDSAKLSWSAPGDDGTEGTATSYDIRYSETAITVNTWGTAQRSSEVITPESAGTKQSVTISGLEQNTNYYFAMKTGDEVPNWSDLSNVVSGKTLGVSKPALAVKLTPSKTMVESGEMFNLDVLAQTQDTSTAVAGATVAVTSDNNGVIFSPSTQTTNNEGKLTFGITAPMLSEKTNIMIFTTVTHNDYKSNYTWVTITVNAITVDNQFNLRITEGDISLSQETVTAGDVVTISAVVSNNGLLDATGFIIRLYVNNIQLGKDKDFSDLTNGDTATTESSWSAFEGTHTVRVEIIPDEPVLDADSSDNEAEISVTVEPKAGTRDDDDQMGGLATPVLLGIIIVIVVIIAILLLLSRGEAAKEKEQSKDERVEEEEK